MKKFIKRGKRKGFTLVETMLAVFILVVISVMLVNGFITTMGYSYQTAIYNKSAAMNYSLCMNETGKWNKKSNYLGNGREAYMAAAGNTLVTGNLIFIPSLEYSSCETLSVVIDKTNTNWNSVVPNSLLYEDTRYVSTTLNPSLVDNRTTFYYYPEYYTAEGDVIVMKNSMNKNNITYSWVIVPEHAYDAADNTIDYNKDVYDYDDFTGKNIINYDADLSKAKVTPIPNGNIIGA